MCAYSKEKERWVFPLVCLRWQRHLGLCSSWFCGPRGWSCKLLLAGVQCTFPALPTKASSTTAIRALLWEGAAGWRPQSFPSCFETESSERANNPLWPQWAKLKDILGKMDEFFHWQCLHWFQCSSLTQLPCTDCPQNHHWSISYSDVVGGDSRKEMRFVHPWTCWAMDEVQPAAPRIRDHGMWHQSHGEEETTKQELRTWQLALPVWTTSIFIAFENAIMSVISTDYTTFFIVCINRHGMMELQLM